MQAMGFTLQKPAFELVTSSTSRTCPVRPMKIMTLTGSIMKHTAGLAASKHSRQSAVVRAIAAPARTSAGKA